VTEKESLLVREDELMFGVEREGREGRGGGESFREEIYGRLRDLIISMYRSRVCDFFLKTQMGINFLKEKKYTHKNKLLFFLFFK